MISRLQFAFTIGFQLLFGRLHGQISGCVVILVYLGYAHWIFAARRARRPVAAGSARPFA
jgi:hypothetical protein